jgi:hypothetical protein
MRWARFWAILSQTHLVTLLEQKNRGTKEGSATSAFAAKTQSTQRPPFLSLEQGDLMSL